MKPYLYRCVIAFLVFLATASPNVSAQDSVEKAMDGIVTRLYAEKSLEQLYALTHAEALAYLTPGERQALATKHWYFDVDVPVVVSLLRETGQKVLPWWIEETGFKKTDLRVTNVEGWEYEVWQKEFPAGRVELGVNGLDNHRPHYLVVVGPREPGQEVRLNNFHPAHQTVLEMQPGAMTYHDWTELVLDEVPEALRGQQLLTSIRGRGKEGALVGAFRETPFVSGEKPAPVFLTWSDDPQTTQNIQWRTSTAVEDGMARIREKGSQGDFREVTAERLRMEDRMLANDRYCHWFTSVARDLKPGTTYEYQVGSHTNYTWSDVREFKTAPAEPEAFTFIHCSDVHSNELWGNLLAETVREHAPEADFVTISGDLVGTGLEREDWDMTLTYGMPAFSQIPVMPAIGNHDAQLGLGAGMYLDIFGLPENGPESIPAEAAYHFEYSNAEFFVLDVMSENAPQREWLKEVLAASDATWKVAVFHFPPYAQDEEYPGLVEAWGTLFDEHQVDLVLTGHVHTYMRTYPLHGGQPVDAGEHGTVYVTSVSIPSRPSREEKPDKIEKAVGGGLLCNVIDVNEDNLRFRAMTTGGEVKDEFVLRK